MWLKGTATKVTVPFNRDWYTGGMSIFRVFWESFERFFQVVWREYLAVFLGAVGVYGVIAPRGGFIDPDSFYHAKMAVLMLENGFVRGMPQLPFTTLAESFADHHLLYHLALIPFLVVFGALKGTAIATVFFGSLAVLAIYGALKAYGVRWAPLFIAIVATSGGFAFRMGLAKASAVAVVLVMLTLVEFRRGRKWPLFLIAMVYVWTHGGWPVMVIIGSVFVAARFFAELVDMVGRQRSLVSSVVGSWRSVEMGGFMAVLAGLGTGLVINPYFPVNFRFYWEQIVKIAIIGHGAGVNVGREWYPFGVGEFVSDAGGVVILIVILVLVVAAIFIFDVPKKAGVGKPTERQVIDVLALSAISFIFWILTLRSRRHLEYFAPLATIAVGVIFTWISSVIDWRVLALRVRNSLLLPKVAVQFLVTYAGVALLVVGARSLYQVQQLNRVVIPWTKYEKVSAWISEHDKRALVLTSSWDDFPPLFYQNEQLRQVSGLDPMFLYSKDPGMYWILRGLTDGNDRNIGSQAKKHFGASYVLIRRDFEEMMAVADLDKDLEKVFEDDGFVLYAIL